MHTVLVVEDNQQIQNVLKMVLQDIVGFEVIQALTLKEAKESFEANSSKLNVIIMDRNLGSGIDTDAFIISIRNSGFSNPIVAFSGDEDARREQLELGCSHELEKPVGLDKLISFFNELKKL